MAMNNVHTPRYDVGSRALDLCVFRGGVSRSTDHPTDRPTDRPTDQPTDRPIDRPGLFPITAAPRKRYRVERKTWSRRRAQKGDAAAASVNARHFRSICLVGPRHGSAPWTRGTAKGRRIGAERPRAAVREAAEDGLERIRSR